MKTIENQTMTDHSYYIFEDRFYKKGQLVLAIMAKLARRKTFDQLMELFDGDFQASYHIIERLHNARKVSTTKKRFFTNTSNILTSRDGVKFCVCNQITKSNVKSVIKTARQLNLEISKVPMRA